MPKLVMRFDMRNPQPGTPKDVLYRTAIEMAVWADEHGFDTVQFSQHHGSGDAYLPSPIVLAAAVASRTRRIGLRFGVALLPLYHPIKLAEDIAVLDIISGGRVTATFGAGYARHEFEMFGVDPADRAKLMEEGVEAIKNAWTGEPFLYQGRRARVMPTPIQQPRPPIWLGGSSPAAARRAARIADHFYGADPALYGAFRQEKLRLGQDDPGPYRDIGTGFFVVADDPDAEWEKMGSYIAHEVRSYSEWSNSGDTIQNQFPPPDLAVLKSIGAYPILTPDEGVKYALERGENGELSVHPLISGLPPEIGWAQLERFARDVLPRLQ
jgi:alkanesulfonate monooxygenase SsuD/methylene tetrahydromethanopterin reductase-like flavin-dependent oxidoreductase (luciferase family)